MRIVRSISLCLCIFTATMAFPNGAPELACEGMVPGHLPTTTSGSNPFKLAVSSTTYKPGDTITGTLAAPDGSELKGFLIEVGTSSTVSERERAIGEFTVLGTDQKHVCGKAAITHTSNKEKKSVSFQWTAPNTSQGELYVRATVVQQFFPSKYWLGAFSSPIKPM